MKILSPKEQIELKLSEVEKQINHYNVIKTSHYNTWKTKQKWGFLAFWIKDNKHSLKLRYRNSNYSIQVFKVYKKFLIDKLKLLNEKTK
jgi:hypothetical protein